MCDKVRTPESGGVYLQGDWYCGEKCKHGGKALKTFDELIHHVRMAFSDQPEVLAKTKDAILRTLETL